MKNQSTDASTWQVELQKHWPIVTDAAFDNIRAEAEEQYARTKNPLLALMITALSSLRSEVARMEHSWIEFSAAHSMRMAFEIEVRDKVIKAMTAPESKARAAA